MLDRSCHSPCVCATSILFMDCISCIYGLYFLYFWTVFLVFMGCISCIFGLYFSTLLTPSMLLLTVCWLIPLLTLIPTLNGKHGCMGFVFNLSTILRLMYGVCISFVNNLNVDVWGLHFFLNSPKIFNNCAKKGFE